MILEDLCLDFENAYECVRTVHVLFLLNIWKRLITSLQIATSMPRCICTAFMGQFMGLVNVKVLVRGCLCFRILSKFASLSVKNKIVVEQVWISMKYRAAFFVIVIVLMTLCVSKSKDKDMSFEANVHERHAFVT